MLKTHPSGAEHLVLSCRRVHSQLLRNHMSAISLGHTLLTLVVCCCVCLQEAACSGLAEVLEHAGHCTGGEILVPRFKVRSIVLVVVGARFADMLMWGYGLLFKALHGRGDPGAVLHGMLCFLITSDSIVAHGSRSCGRPLVFLAFV